MASMVKDDVPLSLHCIFSFLLHISLAVMPVFSFCCSVENSEYLSDLLKDQNIPHNVLNARPKVLQHYLNLITSP